MTDPQNPSDLALDREEQLRKVTVGELQEVNDAIYIVEYDPVWPSRFEQEARRIRVALGDRVLRLEHVGSTSVPGLAAKPILDILLVVTDTVAEAAYVPALEAAGYVLRIRESEWYEHRMFKRSDPEVNLHCLSEGCPEIARMLKLRDWLRVNEEDRLSYERTKRELAGNTWRYVQDYADAKTAIVEEILRRVR